MGKSVKTLNLGVDEFGDDVLKIVIDYIKALKKRGLKIRSIVVFGSRARGDYRPWSDVDVLVIAENLPKAKRWEVLWIGEVEPRGYTPKEFFEALWKLDMTALDACHEGKVIFDDGFWKKALEEFKRVKKKYMLRRLKDGWEVKIVLQEKSPKQSRHTQCN